MKNIHAACVTKKLRTCFSLSRSVRTPPNTHVVPANVPLCDGIDDFHWIDNGICEIGLNPDD